MCGTGVQEKCVHACMSLSVQAKGVHVPACPPHRILSQNTTQPVHHLSTNAKFPKYRSQPLTSTTPAKTCLHPNYGGGEVGRIAEKSHSLSQVGWEGAWGTGAVYHLSHCPPVLLPL